jgi:hypothetical protein
MGSHENPDPLANLPFQLPHATATALYVVEDESNVKVSKRSPRLRKVLRETGIDFEEIVALHRKEFLKPGVLPDIAMARFEGAQARRREKLMMVVNTRGGLVVADAAAAEEAAAGGGGFAPVVVEEKGEQSSMLEAAQAGLQKMMAAETRRQAKDEKHAAEVAKLTAERAADSAERAKVFAEREETKAKVVEKARRRAEKERKKREEENVLEEQEVAVLEAKLAARRLAKDALLDATLAQRREQRRLQALAGVEKQKEVQATVAERQRREQIAKEAARDRNEILAAQKQTALLEKQTEVQAAVMAANAKEEAQAARMAKQLEDDVKNMEKAQVEFKVKQEYSVKRMKAAEDLMWEEVADKQRARASKAVRKHARQKIVLQEVVRLKAAADVKRAIKTIKIEEASTKKALRNEIKAERSKVMLENKLDEVKRHGKVQQYKASLIAKEVKRKDIKTERLFEQRCAPSVQR